MNWLLSLSMLLCVVGLKPEPTRVPHREAAVASEFVVTEFACLVAATPICWDVGGQRACAGAAGLVDGMLAPPKVCDAAADPHFMLTFEPRLDARLFVLSMVHVAESGTDRVRVVCWADADDVGDESLGVSLEPISAMAVGDKYQEAGIGRAVGGPVAACRVYAGLEFFAIWAW